MASFCARLRTTHRDVSLLCPAKPVNELILERIAKSREPLPRRDVFEKFPRYSYALDRILEIEEDAGHIKRFDRGGKVFYEITEKGRELLTYRFGRKFFRLKA